MKDLLRSMLDSAVGRWLRTLGEHLLFPWPVRKLHFQGDRYANRCASSVLRPGCNLVGFARGDFGLAEHLRNTVASMADAEVPSSVYNYGRTAHEQYNRALEELIDQSAPHRCNLFCLNNDSVLYMWLHDRQLFRNRYNIGYGYWELSDFPNRWLPAMNVLDEVWAPSQHIQAMLAAKASVPVVHMPVAVAVSEVPGRWKRSDFGLPADNFVVLVVFDFSSTVQRKNPLAAVRAFRAAFPADEDGVTLVLKCKTNESVDYQVVGRDMVRAAIAADPRILFIDQLYPRDKLSDLINCCDVCLSLHRAEGFGLVMAEAMALAKPVVATGYSGNMDFMNPANSFLVDYRLEPVGPAAAFGLEGVSSWAEPESKHAAHYLRRLAGDAALRAATGARARAHIQQHFNHQVIGQRMRKRLELIGVLQ